MKWLWIIVEKEEKVERIRILVLTLYSIDTHFDASTTDSF